MGLTWNSSHPVSGWRAFFSDLLSVVLRRALCRWTDRLRGDRSVSSSACSSCLTELLFFPGVTLLALLGTALMVGALLFAMVDFYPSQPLDLSLEVLMRPLLNLGIALILFLFAVSALARFLPDLPFFNRLILATQSASGPSLERSTPAIL